MRRHGYTLLGYLTWRLVWRERVRAHVRRAALVGAAVVGVAAAVALVTRRRSA